VSHEHATIFVIPKRMTEAWLLVDEMAIRLAAGNPNGLVKLKIPSLTKLNTQVDPKKLLFNALEQASELAPNRLRRFDVHQARRQVGGFMEDISVLLKLTEFVHFETQVKTFFMTNNAS
jgi:hypothetical protein